MRIPVAFPIASPASAARTSSSIDTTCRETKRLLASDPSGPEHDDRAYARDSLTCPRGYRVWLELCSQAPRGTDHTATERREDEGDSRDGIEREVRQTRPATASVASVPRQTAVPGREVWSAHDHRGTRALSVSEWGHPWARPA